MGNNKFTIDLEVDKLKVNAPCPYCRKHKVVHLLYEPQRPILEDLEKRKIIKLSNSPITFHKSPKYYCHGCKSVIFDDSKICPICWHKIDDKITRTCSHCGWKRDLVQEQSPDNTWGCNVIPFSHYQDNWILILSLTLGDSICIYPLDITNSYFEGIFIKCLTTNKSPMLTPVIVIKTKNDEFEYIPIGRIQAIQKIKPLPISLKETNLNQSEVFRKNKFLKPVFSSQNKDVI